MLLPTHLERVRVAYLAAAALETLDPVPIADLGVKVLLVSTVGSTRRRRGAMFLHRGDHDPSIRTQLPIKSHQRGGRQICDPGAISGPELKWRVGTREGGT